MVLIKDMVGFAVVISLIAIGAMRVVKVVMSWKAGAEQALKTMVRTEV